MKTIAVYIKSIIDDTDSRFKIEKNKWILYYIKGFFKTL